MEQVLAALIRSGLVYHKLNLGSAGRQIEFEAMLDFGYLLAVLLRRKPICAPPRGRHSFSFRKNDSCRELKVLFNCPFDVRMTGVCSASAGLPRLKTLSIGRWVNQDHPGVQRMHRSYWGWLEYTLSSNSI